jgi:TRAP-type C4-dicarboxylate transport system substrate-binding protein
MISKQDLTKSSKLSQNRVLKRTAFLCLGAVAGRLSEEERERYRDISQQEETVRTLLAKESNSQSRKELKDKKVELEDRKKKEKRIHTQIKQEIVKVCYFSNLYHTNLH